MKNTMTFDPTRIGTFAIIGAPDMLYYELKDGLTLFYSPASKLLLGLDRKDEEGRLLRVLMAREATAEQARDWVWETRMTSGYRDLLLARIGDTERAKGGAQ